MLLGSGSVQKKRGNGDEGEVWLVGEACAADGEGIMVVAKELDMEGKDGVLELRLRVPDVRQVLKGLMRKREVGEFASGALAGAMTKAVLAPLETLRTRMVVGVGPKHIMSNFLEIIEHQGWQGLWAGNTINMLRIVPTQAIELATFECVKRTVLSAQEKWKEEGGPKLRIGHVHIDLSFSWVSPVAVGGAAAGIVSTLVCHPLEVIKDRLTINREAYPSIGLAFRKIYRDDGIRGLYAGISPTLMGLTASTISFPLEVARKRLMVGSLQGKCPPHMAAALAEVVREEGLMGLYRGWGASSLKVMPNSGITWMFYELWKDILLVERSHL